MIKSKNTALFLLIFTIVALFLACLFFHDHAVKNTQLDVLVSDQVTLIDTEKHVALLGCTPRIPRKIAEDAADGKISFSNLTLSDFIDIKDLADSFRRTFEVCKIKKVDCLVIAYLPIYFIDMKKLFGNRFVPTCHAFLEAIVPQIASIINQEKHQTDFAGHIVLVSPPSSAFEQIPDQESLSFEERICYLIKQFPHFNSIKNVRQITIINNESPHNITESAGILQLLRYEYLFDTNSITFEKCSFGKERFHRYIV